ncbi:UDP-N-acetylmuramoyl-L-alanine--D-glutamate ligase [Trichlorobacter lovleyi]|uniref:UDP-N-acetylmuramoylalanine--D-glutamate ligase n=1 Tax=Trichlorobacter lovleyi (strain ATCC BAA-1151 / DSM 17278 / SZ) TaxID=398767 RepID=MURD_TRIL1|nr:UDP-N-acetylmuramoyl-L-alanine--D-glutamate ligase [Trichlorobacter lovleyi]B3E3Y4.1 RecName: Full=UDP-N-acetylmuramoylalanine--D-glutamate ligase; AltName: Full=D-glutamic acid-adding enzyme; AltName: Full=UDP-N-acetylmuramoyl-L-alanyl-D-glutamate synthetase [Trichlorobacter lovleyi SZ]ACD94398.1 UDP-N-acetylmuramoylalanine/D-glutamate ligase [Trichlorobacter lovleyi SZ]
MELRTKKTTVMGLAKTGVASARFLAQQGARVTATDMRDETALATVLSELAGLDIRFVLGHHDEADFTAADLVVVSPGVPQEHPLLRKTTEAGVAVVSEIELASRFITAPLVAITGTNGKTTTTTLAGELFRANGFSTYVGGNIGDPLIDLPASGEPVERAVAEISSFQLEWISSFRPKVAALLNITEDHLDRYPSYQAYINAKLRIFENQTADDFAVVNRDDELVWQAAQSLKAQLFPFSRRHELTEGIFSREGELLFRHHGQELSIPTAGFRLQGVHNLENIMAALACCLLLGCQRETSLELLNRFEALHHRMEFVREVADVRYFEDSKATNVGSVAKALESFENITLIAGGKDKGGSYAPLAELVQQRVRHLVLIGEAAERMQQELGDLTATHKAATLEEAVQLSADLTAPGGVVLLSPACSSFDMFKDYEERAQRFITAVKRL